MRRVAPEGMALVSRWPRPWPLSRSRPALSPWLWCGARPRPRRSGPNCRQCGAAGGQRSCAARGHHPPCRSSTTKCRPARCPRPDLPLGQWGPGVRGDRLSVGTVVSGGRVVRGGRAVPRAWPRAAAIESSSGHLPPSISDSLPSANWAGYEDTGAGAQFTEVTGSWVVPTVAENPYGDSSTWVGIDGIQSQGDLVQAGTDQSWTASGYLYYAWYELLPQASVELGVVAPGDHITVKIDEVQTGTWTISVDDLTQDTDWTNSVSYSAPGTSAEWVEEAPTLSYANVRLRPWPISGRWRSRIWRSKDQARPQPPVLPYIWSTIRTT